MIRYSKLNRIVNTCKCSDSMEHNMRSKLISEYEALQAISKLFDIKISNSIKYNTLTLNGQPPVI